MSELHHYEQDGNAVQAEGFTVKGWLMRFNLEGLDGMSFLQDTKTSLPGRDEVTIPNTPILWRHGGDPVGTEAIGTLQSAERRDEGIWVEGILHERSKYVAAVRELLQRGALGWSAGAIAHLVRVTGKAFQEFPIVEATLTPSPKQPLATATQDLSAGARALLADVVRFDEQEMHRVRVQIAEARARGRS